MSVVGTAGPYIQAGFSLHRRRDANVLCLLLFTIFITDLSDNICLSVLICEYDAKIRMSIKSKKHPLELQKDLTIIE